MKRKFRFNIGEVFYPELYDEKTEDFIQRIAGCIDRYNFIALYAINPDVLHLALVAKIREMGIKAETDEILEELVRVAIDVLKDRIFISDEETELYGEILAEKMSEVIKEKKKKTIFKQMKK